MTLNSAGTFPMMKFPSLIVLGCLVAAIGCNKSETPSSSSVTGSMAGTTGSLPGGTTTAGAPGTGAPKKQGISKLKEVTKEDLVIGNGMLQGIKVGDGKATVAQGDLVSLEYTGKLFDGTMFDTNLPGSKLNGQPNKHAKPLAFYVGRQSVVPGLEQGVIGMKIGGKRKIGIPAALAYGNRDNDVIPANSDLQFEVTLLDIVKPGEEGVFDFKDLGAGSGRAIKKGDTVQIDYTVKLADGTVVDTSKGKAPGEFTIGEVPPRVYSGLEQGVMGMKKGGERLLRIPPHIAYGTKKIPGDKVPPNSTLIVQVKILEVM